MDSNVPLFGRPYGGCCIFYKKSLAGCVLICPTGSRRLNAITVQLVGGQLLFIANVYFPTDDGTSSSKDNLNDTLGELEGLLIAQQFDYKNLVWVVIGRGCSLDVSATLMTLPYCLMEIGMS